MIGKITKIEKRSSRYGGHFFYVFFSGIDGKKYYSCIYPKMRNYKRWKNVLEEGTMLKRLRIFKGNLVDADSKFEIMKEKD